MGAWIEIGKSTLMGLIIKKSHPTMGAWIEIWTKREMYDTRQVAPHDGCVD